MRIIFLWHSSTCYCRTRFKAFETQFTKKQNVILYRLHTAICIALALVKCSNDGGPGPRHNMKEDPGSSIFSMLVVNGYYLHLLTTSQNQVTGRTSVDPLPPFKPTWAEPPPPSPWGTHSTTCKDEPEAGLGEITLQPLIRGRRPQIGLEEDVETILGFSARL